VFYTDSSTSKPTWANHLEASNAATDIVAFVADDPYERFEIQVNSTLAVADVFSNGDIVYAAGDSANYISKVELNAATVTTDSDVQLKILGATRDDENNTLLNATTYNANVNVVCSINEHFLAKGTAGI